MRRFLIAVLVLAAFSTSAIAECPCVPVTHLWVVKTCTDWNCASTELLLANGDPQVFAVPIALDDLRWLIVRRNASGAAVAPSDDPFGLEQFDRFSDAADRYSTIEAARHPILMNAPDGTVLVIALREPPVRRRAGIHQ